MGIPALHPERRYARTPIVSLLIEQLDKGSAYHIYQLCCDERYRVQGELNKVFANAALARKAWPVAPAISLEEAAPLLASNQQFQAKIAEHVVASDRSEARKANIVAALRLIERLPSENVLLGNALASHVQSIVSALNFEVQAMARARLDSLRTASTIDRDRVEYEAAALVAQSRHFLSSAMPRVSASDQHSARQLARGYLGESDQIAAEFAAKLVEQRTMLRESRLRKKDAQIIRDIDDALRSFLCSVAVAYRFLMLADSRPDSKLVRAYQAAATKLPLTRPRGKWQGHRDRRSDAVRQPGRDLWHGQGRAPVSGRTGQGCYVRDRWGSCRS